MKIKFVLIGFLMIGLLSCHNSYTPKPRGYFRIDFPAKEYDSLPQGFPFHFLVPKYAELSQYSGQYSSTNESEDWLNVDFPDFSAHIYLTHKYVDENLAKLIEDAHTFAYKHSIKAEAIVQSKFAHSVPDVYGIVYEIKGNTASSLQFFCTDSSSHFLRGALYFDTEPNKDSLAPVIEFISKDIRVLIQSLEWEHTKK
ncbi:MAG: gliding motility lipoprotein GldD [Bacteroidales bacterium]|nr:gliding motility lipoprotein GldD [Bacteroidales bacterium]